MLRPWRALNLSLWYGPLILVSRYLVLTVVNWPWHGCPIDIKAVPKVMVLLSYFSRYWAWSTDIWMYRRSRYNQFFLDQWFTKFSKVWGSAWTPSVNRSSATTVPLEFPAKCVCNRPSNTCLANPRRTNKTQDWTCITSNNTGGAIKHKIGPA